jgi:methylamine dehydrogenase heavy chain
LTPKAPLYSRQRNEVYSVDLAYARGNRGQRTDFITIYDGETLAVRGEIIVPTRVAESNTSQAYAALLDDQRFLAVFNQFPNTSVSIVDLEMRRFVEEIVVTGCSGIYPVAPLRFATLCGDGTVVDVVLDAEGHKQRLTRSPSFFDVVKDPVSISGGRAGTRWTFISFEGVVHTVDFAGDTPTPAAPWPLMSDSERSQHWRSGGLQHVALHGPSGRLYLVMHQGGAGSHKDPGPEIWVYDMDERERVARFETPNLTAAFLSPLMGVAPGSFSERVLHWIVPSAGVHTIAVTQDANPLLFARNAETGAVAVLDAKTGDPLRILTEAGLAGPTLRVH